MREETARAIARKEELVWIFLLCTSVYRWSGVFTCKFGRNLPATDTKNETRMSEEPQQLDQPNRQMMAERKVSKSETIVTRVERLEKVRGAKLTA